MTRENEIANAASEAMTETLMSCPTYEFSPKATDLLECAYIKGAEWADIHPANHWHSVKAGELPQAGKVCMFGYQGKLYKGSMFEDGALHFEDEFSPMLDINEVDYWMTIPELPTE